MKLKDKLDGGRGVAYVGVVTGIAISIAGNVAHAYVPTPNAPSDPPLGMVISSVIWPLILFLTLEIMLSARWPAGWYFQAVRWGVLGVVGAVAAVVSYQHLSGLLQHWHETEFAWRAGPLAVDGLLIMSSAAIVLARLRASAALTAVPVPDDVPVDVPVPSSLAATHGLPDTLLPVATRRVAADVATSDAPRTTVKVPDAKLPDTVLHPGALSANARLILKALPGTISELADRTGVKRTTVDYQLKHALAQLVTQDGTIWRLVSGTST